MGKSDQDKFARMVQEAISTAFEEVKPTSNRIDEIINNPEVVSKFFKDLFTTSAEKKPEPILRLISDGANLKIGACTGKRTIANAKKVFKSFISSFFKKQGLDQPGSATGETPIDVYEMINYATSEQMFTSRSTYLDRMVMSQDQIIEFCEQHPDWLRQDGHATFFLIKRADYSGLVCQDSKFGSLRYQIWFFY